LQLCTGRDERTAVIAQGAGGVVITDLQNAGIDGGGAGVGVDTGEGQGSAAGFGDGLGSAGFADGSGERKAAADRSGQIVRKGDGGADGVIKCTGFRNDGSGSAVVEGERTACAVCDREGMGIVRIAQIQGAQSHRAVEVDGLVSGNVVVHVSGDARSAGYTER